MELRTSASADAHFPDLSFIFSVEQKLMSDLEVKEKDLNKLKARADLLLKSSHPASDKIQVREPEGWEQHHHGGLSVTSSCFTRLTGTLCRLSGAGCCRSPSVSTCI